MINNDRQRACRIYRDGTENQRLESRKPSSWSVSTIAKTTKVKPDARRKSTGRKRTRLVFTWKICARQRKTRVFLRKLGSDSTAWCTHSTRKVLRTNVHMEGKFRASLWTISKFQFSSVVKTRRQCDTQK